MILKCVEFDLRNYEVVRVQFFASANMTSMSVSKSGIRFSSGCVRRFTPTEYVELWVHPHTMRIAVLPCSESHRNKVRWARICAGGVSAMMISGSAFLSTLYGLFDWDADKRYRLRGEIIQAGKETVALFDANTPEIFTSRYDMTIPWAIGFGEEYYDYRKSRLPKAATPDEVLEYDTAPELRPTAQINASKNVHTLIKNMKKDGRLPDADTGGPS